MFKGWRMKRKVERRRRDFARKVDGLEKAYPTIDWKPFRDITGFFADRSLSSVEEQAFLYRLAAAAPADAQVIEIGSWLGQGTCTLAAPLRGNAARCYAVDAFACWSDTPGENAHYRRLLDQVSPGRSQLQIFEAHVARFGLEKRIQVVQGDSRQAAGRLPLKPASADLVFIDGGHDLETVRLDVANYLPFLKPGGVAAFHDFSSTCGVPEALWEAIRAGTFADLLGIHGSLIAFRKA